MPTKRELQAKLCKLLEAEGASFGSDALAGELVDVIEKGAVLKLDTGEPPARVLPGRLWLSPRIMDNLDPDQPKGWYIRSDDDDGGPAILAIRRHPVWPAEEDRAERLIGAMTAAYNERQEMDEIEADVDDAISTGLAALCREEIDAEVQRGVQDERDRCLGIVKDLEANVITEGARVEARLAISKILGGGEASGPAARDAAGEAFMHGEEKGVAGECVRCLAIFDAFLSDLPAGWDFVRLRAREARGKVESGPAANDGVPSAEPTYPCAECGALRTKDEGGTTFTVCDACWDKSHHSVAVPAWTGADDLPNPEPAGDWPPFLEPIPAGSLGSSFWVSKKSVGTAYLSRAEAEEVCRRWEDAPKLRAEVECLREEVANWRRGSEINGSLASERWYRVKDLEERRDVVAGILASLPQVLAISEARRILMDISPETDS